jgi:hypothetical protein
MTQHPRNPKQSHNITSSTPHPGILGPDHTRQVPLPPGSSNPPSAPQPSPAPGKLILGSPTSPSQPSTSPPPGWNTPSYQTHPPSQVYHYVLVEPSPLPKRRSSSPWIVLVVLLVLGLIGAGGYGAFIVIRGFIQATVPSGNHLNLPITTGTTPTVSTSSLTNMPEQVIDDFCGGLGGFKNYQAAYDEYSQHLQSQVSFNDFVTYWSGNNAQYYTIDRCPHQTIIPSPTEDIITEPWSTHEFYSGQILHYTVTFVIQGNEGWKIGQIVSA